MVLHDLSMLAATAVVAAAGSVSLAWAASLGRDRVAVSLMALSYLLLVPVAAVALFFPPEQLHVRALVGNSAHLASAALLLAGLRRFWGQRTWPPVMVVFTLVAIAINAILTVVHPDRELRLAAFNLCHGVLRLGAILVLLSIPAGRDRPIARAFAAVLALEALTTFWRAVTVASVGVPLIGIDTFGAQAPVWLSLLFSTAFGAPLLMLLTLTRVVGDHRQAAARLRNTLDALPDMVFEVGSDGRYVSFHTSRPDLLAAPPESIIGRMPEEVLPEHVMRVQRLAMSQVDQQGRSSGIQYPMELPGGTRWFEVSAAAREADLPGTSHGYVFVVRDVTERLQTQEALHYRTTLFSHLFERSPIALVLSRYGDRRILEANPAFLQMIAIDPEQVGKRTTTDFIAETDLPRFQALREELHRSGACGPVELMLVHTDGHEIPVRLSALALIDPQEEVLIWTMIEDLTERKRIERLKSEFLSLVSHELRTPLTSISGALELLAVAQIVEDAPQRTRLLDIARNNSQRLRVLIDDLLDMDKLLAGKMRFDLRQQALAPLLESAIESHRTYGGDHPMRLEAGDEVRSLQAMIDGERLQQVLANLLSNACKFSPPGSPVELSLTRSGRWARIAVRDHGPGVPEAFQPHLFEKFTQAEAGNARLKGGSGLGLAIVRELSLRMGGHAGYEPAAGGGALFYVNLPIEGSGLAAHPGAQPSA
jgi:PAS domain S-box-containing protein